MSNNTTFVIPADVQVMHLPDISSAHSQDTTIVFSQHSTQETQRRLPEENAPYNTQTYVKTTNIKISQHIRTPEGLLANDGTENRASRHAVGIHVFLPTAPNTDLVGPMLLRAIKRLVKEMAEGGCFEYPIELSGDEEDTPAPRKRAFHAANNPCKRVRTFRRASAPVNARKRRAPVSKASSDIEFADDEH